MTYKRLDRMIFEAALDILREEEADASQEKTAEKPDPKKKKKKDKISVSGAYGGGGRFALEVEAAKSRATEDPFRLVKELGIKTSTGRNDLEKAASVLNQTIKNNEVMAEAFKAPRALGVVDKKGRTVAGYEIGFASDDLKYRDAVKYVYATLLAAENAGVLKFDSGIGFVQAQLTDKPAFYGM